MGTQNVLLVGATLGCTFLAACGAAIPPDYEGNRLVPERGDDMPRRMASATVIHTDRLGRRSGNVLSILRTRVRNMTVRSSMGCPTITLRGNKSLVLPSNPEVFVNGQRANDTCILESIPIDDVERVEVYPMGVSSRPGYPAHPHGLILVFLRR